MKNIICDINTRDFKELVFDRFKKLCGFFENPNVDTARIDEAVLCFDKYFGNYDVKAIYSFFDKNIFIKKEIHIDENILKGFYKKDIYKFVFFAVSAMDVENIKRSFLEEFYYDLTGTALIDITKNILKNNILNYNKNNFFVSDAFGIGFFGIEHKEIFKLFMLLDCGKIGLFINERGIMNPCKSFFGFFIVSEKEIFIENDCVNCVGNRNGCFLCKK